MKGKKLIAIGLVIVVIISSLFSGCTKKASSFDLKCLDIDDDYTRGFIRYTLYNDGGIGLPTLLANPRSSVEKVFEYEKNRYDIPIEAALAFAISNAFYGTLFIRPCDVYCDMKSMGYIEDLDDISYDKIVRYYKQELKPIQQGEKELQEYPYNLLSFDRRLFYDILKGSIPYIDVNYNKMIRIYAQFLAVDIHDIISGYGPVPSQFPEDKKIVKNTNGETVTAQVLYNGMVSANSHHKFFDKETFRDLLVESEEILDILPAGNYLHLFVTSSVNYGYEPDQFNLKYMELDEYLYRYGITDEDYLNSCPLTWYEYFLNDLSIF